jgi:hypothetical protein
MDHVPELDSDSTVHSRPQPAQGDVVACEGKTTSVFEPDFAREIDERNGWKEPGTLTESERDEAISEASGIFSAVLSHCWLDCNGKLRKPDAALRRFCALSMLVKPDLFAGASYNSMGARIDCTKAALSKLAIEFSDKFGLHFRRSRRDSARRTFKRVSRQTWAKKKCRQRQACPVESPHKP